MLCNSDQPAHLGCYTHILVFIHSSLLQVPVFILSNFCGILNQICYPIFSLHFLCISYQLVFLVFHGICLVELKSHTLCVTLVTSKVNNVHQFYDQMWLQDHCATEHLLSFLEISMLKAWFLSMQSMSWVSRLDGILSHSRPNYSQCPPT